MGNKVIKTGGDSIIKRKEVEEIVKKLGEITSWCALGIVPPQSICDSIQRLHRDMEAAG